MFISAADAQDVDGDCNVMNTRAASAEEVTIEITCNNTSAEVIEQLHSILQSIEEISKNSSNDELVRGLSILGNSSRSYLSEMRRSRPPELIIQGWKDDSCPECNPLVAISNIGGHISGIADFRVDELIDLRLRWSPISSTRAYVDNESCPADWVQRPDFFDYFNMRFSLSLQRFETYAYEVEGQIVAKIDFPSRDLDFSSFIDDAITQYNDHNEFQGEAPVDLDLGRRCLDIQRATAVKITTFGNNGSAYNTFFMFDLERQNGLTGELEDFTGPVSAQDYERTISHYDYFKDPTRADQRLMPSDAGVVGSFLSLD